MKSKTIVLDMNKTDELTNDQVIFAHHFEHLNNAIIDCVEQLVMSSAKKVSNDVVIDSICHQLVMMSAYIALSYKRSNEEGINKYMNKISKTSTRETLKIFTQKDNS